MLKFLTLALAWLLMSGHYTYSLEDPKIAVFGLLSCAAVAWVVKRMVWASGYQLDRSLGLKTLLYLPWLLKEIVKSNLQVARIILDPRLPISPRIIRVEASQRSEEAQVLFANSITLTPGTISLDLRSNTITVHALTREFADGLGDGEMARRVAECERSA